MGGNPSQVIRGCASFTAAAVAAPATAAAVGRAKSHAAFPAALPPRLHASRPIGPIPLRPVRHLHIHLHHHLGIKSFCT